MSAVDHPKHYNLGGIEVIGVIEAWDLGFHAGNAIKYIARAKHKGRELEDLRKAQWYLNRLIERLGESRLCADCARMNDCHDSDTLDRKVWHASVDCEKWQRRSRRGDGK